MATVAPKETILDVPVHHYKEGTLASSSHGDFIKFRKCTLFVWITIILILIVAVAIFVTLFAIWNVKLQESRRNAEAVQPGDSKDAAYCDLRVCKRKFDKPPLFIISADGFRNSYLTKNITPAIQRLISCGTHSKYMLPVFPSKTFSNHYTIATGLYPVWNGIVDNYFYDPQFKAFFDKRNKASGWFLGEPIWETVKKAGLKSAVFFWPGSEAEPTLPTYWKNYDYTVPFTTRIDEAIKWLKLPDGERPSLVQVYLEEPDASGHDGGPDSEKVRTAMILIDGMINYLTRRLLEEGLMGCINLVFLSDHGMQKIDSSRSVVAKKYLNPQFDDLFFPGVVARIQVNQSAHPFGFDSDDAVSSMISAMSCQHGNNYLMYKKQLVPVRFHYAGSPRIGDVVIKGRPGVCIFLTDEQKNLYKHLGDHGYDNRIASMRAIFIALGPDFAEKKEIDNFQNIELYNLFSYLLGVAAAPNNGTNGTLFTALRHPPPVPETTTSQSLARCTNMMDIKKCNFSYNCPAMDNIYRNCDMTIDSSISVALNFTDELCSLKFCNAIIHFDNKLRKTIIVEGILRRTNWKREPENGCVTYIYGITPTNSCNFSPDENYTSISLFGNLSHYDTLDLARVIVPKAFANGIWQYFLNETFEYLAQYGDLWYFSGVAYDQNGDGVRDSDDVIR